MLLNFPGLGVKDIYPPRVAMHSHISSIVFGNGVAKSQNKKSGPKQGKGKNKELLHGIHRVEFTPLLGLPQ